MSEDLKKSIYLGTSLGHSNFSKPGDEGYSASVDKAGNIVTIPLNESFKRMSYNELRKNILAKR